MKKGLLITNRFLNTKKFSELTGYLLRAAEARGIALDVRHNTELLFDAAACTPLFPLSGDFAIFWDKDVRLGCQLEAQGIRLFNAARAVALTDDKSYTHLALAKLGIPMPKTIIAPMTFKGVGYNNTDFLEQVADELGYPFVIKEVYGSFGQQVYLAQDRREAEGILAAQNGTQLLFQKFIEGSRGRDIRVNVVGGEPVAAMLRYNDDGDFRANISNGGKMKPHALTAAQADMAVRATAALGLDFAGVDLLFGPDGEPILCEVNSNAHFKSTYLCCGVNLADVILAHIDRQIYG
jgi:RimK family alpha-L-glutamate ligase